MSLKPVQLFPNKGQGHSFYMEMALKQAAKAFKLDEVPIGAVVIQGNAVVGRGYNQREALKDPTAHAEMIAITAAANTKGDWRLDDCVLYVTKEPCPMCAGAIVHCRLQRVVFGASDLKGGAAGGAMNLLQFPPLNHQCKITSGIMEADCCSLLQTFFQEKRKPSSEDS